MIESKFFASVPRQTDVVPRLTEDENASAWYSRQDINAFKLQESLDAAFLRSLLQTTPTIEALPQEPALYRGLERLLSPQIIYEIAHRRERCKKGVIFAQKIVGLDAESIAQVSKNFTDDATEWALHLASL